MSMKNMTTEQANAVYDILVREAKAPDGSWRDSFVLEFTGERPTNQWRFCGALGFGGKFRFPRLSVDCYREDETPERLRMIQWTNAALGLLKEQWASEGAAKTACGEKQ